MFLDFSQSCYMEMNLFENEDMVNLIDARLYPSEKFMPDNANWDCIEHNGSLVNKVARFNFVFKRKSKYFTTNLFCPCLLLV